MKQKILITGGAGFIGSHLYHHFIGKYDIIIIDNFFDNYDISIKLRNLNLKELPKKNDFTKNLINIDLNNYRSVKEVFENNNFFAIIHAAALPGIRYSMENPHKYISENIRTTLNLIDLAKEYKVNNFIFFSSSSVYGNNETPFHEEMKCSPISIYAQSKLCCENLLKMYSMTYDLNITVLRLFTVYGPSQRPDLVIHKFFSAAFRGKKSEIYGSLESARDYTYISDVVSGVESAMEFTEKNGDFNIFNIGSGREITMRKLLNYIKMFISNFEYSIIDPQIGDMNITLSNIEKAKRILKYEPKMKFENGMKNFSKWFYDNYKK